MLGSGHGKTGTYKMRAYDLILAENHYKWVITFKDGKKVVYHHNSENYKDQTAASDIEYTLKSNPGATVVATKDGKLFNWKALLSETWGMGPKPYKGWTYDVWEDDDGDVRKKFHSAKKDGQTVDMDWSPYDTPDQRDWQLWIDLGMPTREQLGLRGPMRSENLLALAKTKQGTHSLLMKEAVQGGGGVKNLNDYTTKRDYIYQQLADPKQVDNYSHFRQALFDLNRLAKHKGIKIEESRAHKQLQTWFKNRELAQKFASGEVKVPTPQERRAELEKQKNEKQKPGQESSLGERKKTKKKKKSRYPSGGYYGYYWGGTNYDNADAGGGDGGGESLSEGWKSNAVIAALVSALSSPAAADYNHPNNQQKEISPVGQALIIYRKLFNMQKYGQAGLEAEATQELNNIMRSIQGHPNQSKLYPVIKDIIQNQEQELPPLQDPVNESQAQLDPEVEDFLEGLTPDDVGYDEVGDYIVHYEGFTDQCQDTKEYQNDPDAVFDQVWSDFRKRAGKDPVNYGIVGEHDYPIVYSVFRR